MKMKNDRGPYMRSRSQWIEKEINLEARNKINRTVQILTLENWFVVKEHKEYVCQTKVFYAQLYKNPILFEQI